MTQDKMETFVITEHQPGELSSMDIGSNIFFIFEHVGLPPRILNGLAKRLTIAAPY
eukprot:CAMPEP_0172085044 /NCGR_PEP_ID=MMETSP1043-20130122/21330_1 /TAXON_ID=464988 /ORGANISM="Hemiselmis andersenii, Strain CCMP441" /LENGTH=55 /DNA_ID=CAMNT_0012746935 /DNA_START=422 /DNA_END=589 /DNA_ORIENTATION=-